MPELMLGACITFMLCIAVVVFRRALRRDLEQAAKR